MWKIADAHCDTLWEIGVRKSDPEKCMITADRLEKGGVSLQTFALFAGPEGPNGAPYEKAREMLGAADKAGVPINRGALPDTMPETPTGVISIEGGEILEGSLARLDEMHAECRLRMIALTWNNENEIGCPSAKDGAGLKPFGKKLLQEMDAKGIYADVSHLSEKGFWDVCEGMSLPPIASHSNCKELCDVHRNLTRAQIRAVIEKGGYIGINFYTRFLTGEASATTEDVYRHIDAIMDLGGENVLGFGSDFDGIDSWPEGLGNPLGFQSLCDGLLSRGYTRKQVEAIAGGNLYRLLLRGEKAAQKRG